MNGFFTRSQQKQPKQRSATRRSTTTPKAEAGLTQATIQYLQEGGCSLCPLSRVENRTYSMPASGTERPLIYMLGEGPGETEDREGRQFVGSSGRYLRARIPEEFDDRIRWNNSVRCRPPNNRTPTAEEVECCRRSIESDIRATKPRVIVAIGGVALNWAIGESQITKWRGRRIPILVGDHKCWLCPILHPSFVQRAGKSKQEEKQDYPHTFDLDLRALFSFADKLPEPEPEDLSKLQEGVELLDCSDQTLGRLVDFIDTIDGPTSIDLETDRLRPYTADSPINHLLSFAISFAGETLAIPVCHPEATWSFEQLTDLMILLNRYVWLATDTDVVAYNLSFELEWLCTLLKEPVAYLPCLQDGMALAYVLDEHKGTLSLDFQILQNFGFHLKSQSDLDRAKLRSYPLSRVLLYNALDAKYELKHYLKAAGEVFDAGLASIYREHRRRIPTFVIAQRRGLHVNSDKVEELFRESKQKEDEALQKIADDPSARLFGEKTGKRLNPDSPKQLVTLFRDLLGRNEGKRGNGYSVDKDVLKLMADLPIVQLISDLRSVQKLCGTYIEPFLPNGRLLHSDGLIHTQFKTLLTETGRSSSEGPNVQNFPKRRDAYVRSVVWAPPGFSLVSLDYGQLEARLIAQHSQDQYLIDAIKRRYDIHLAWSKRLVELYPAILKRHKDDMKSLRAAMKNQFVFPAFYGSAERSIQNDIEIPNHVAHTLFGEFWATFVGVKAWQKELFREYEVTGCVRALSGRLRRAPLSLNQVLNSPIQGAASDVVIDAMNRISRWSHKQGRPDLHPILNVHDDLTFMIQRDDKFNETVHEIATMMVRCPYRWMTVPLSVEISVGQSWGEMKEVGKVFSDEVSDG